MANELTKRIALVFGVERPHGRQIAVALAEAGADVALVTLVEATAAEFAANSIANEFWAIDRRSIVITGDGDEGALNHAIAETSANLGPVSVLIYLAPATVAPGAFSGLRSDPAIVIVIEEGEPAPDMLAWTRTLSSAGLRANALVVSRQLADAIGPVLKEHKPPQPLDAKAAAVYLASDVSAAVEGAMLVAET